MNRYKTLLILPLIAIAAMAFVMACGDDDKDDGGGLTSADLYGTQTAEASAPVDTPEPIATAVPVTPDQAFADACQKSDEKTFAAAPPRIIDTTKTYVATIQTDKGDIVVEIDNAHAITANNFIFLACKGFYDGLTFHRVEPGFVIQGGDPEGTGGGGPGYAIPGEFEGSNFDRGVIGMARTGDPDSAGSQFYIMIGDDGHNLDGAYADFGHVTDGQDVAEEIAIGDTINEITITEQ